MIKAYLAGPICFYPDAAIIYAELIEKCRLNDIELIVPFDEDEQTEDVNPQWIFRKNIHKIYQCELVFADPTPFRGPSMDAGTIWEIGYAFAQNKAIYGFNKPGEYKDRVEPDGNLIEDFGDFDNLMICASIQYDSFKTFDEMLNVVYDNHIDKV